MALASVEECDRFDFCVKNILKVSNNFSPRDFTAENGGKRHWGMGSSMLQALWKKSLQENWGRSGERPGNRMGTATSSLPARHGGKHEACWAARRALLLAERGGPASPCTVARLHVPQGRSVPALPGSTQRRFPSTSSMPHTLGKSPSLQPPRRAGAAGAADLRVTAGFCILAGLATGSGSSVPGSGSSPATGSTAGQGRALQTGRGVFPRGGTGPGTLFLH